MYEAREELTREFILSRITEEDIFYKYLGIQPNMTDFFTSPFRIDNFPDCKFYRDSRGVLKFNDFAYKINLDCFNVVERLYKLNYGQALHKIANDFDIYNKKVNLSPLRIFERTINKEDFINREIKVQRKEFTKWDLEFWESQGWSKEALELFKVASLHRAWFVRDKKNMQIYEFSKNDPGFVYYFGMSKHLIPLYKLYFPLRKQYKFLQNANQDTIQGYHQLPESGDNLLITKSYKDVGALWGYNIPSIAPMSETILLNEEQFEELNNRFFNIYTLFDRDRAGMIASQQYRKKYNTIPLLFDTERGVLFRKPDEPKDFTDHYKVYGSNFMLDMVEDIKRTL